jgi:hypothetical protein
MIPVGYMYKLVVSKPDWLKTDQVKEIYSVSGCVSKDFDGWINYWKHNGYWFFDSPKIIKEIAKENDIDLSGMKLFFYRVYENQWNDEAGEWEDFKPEESFETNVELPKSSTLHGFDITTFTAQTSAECSPLSCNHMAEELEASPNCLLSSFEEAKQLIESGAFNQCEPGPYRIFEVYSVENA